MSDKKTKRFGLEDVGIFKIGKDKAVNEVTQEEWKHVLPEEVYQVTRESGTEKPGSGGFDNYFHKGTYVCLCCGSQLFNSDSKYWAGCGWPAFFESVGHDLNIIRLEDRSNNKVRTEIRCKQCDAHLGHVYDNEPKSPNGIRYCINSVSMAFEKAD